MLPSKRRKQNKINLLREDDTNTSNISDIGYADVEYYRDLFNKFSLPPDMDRLKKITPSVSEEANDFLTSIPGLKEIQEAIKGMNSDVYPGPDGFSVAFYFICVGYY